MERVTRTLLCDQCGVKAHLSSEVGGPDPFKTWWIVSMTYRDKQACAWKDEPIVRHFCGAICVREWMNDPHRFRLNGDQQSGNGDLAERRENEKRILTVLRSHHRQASDNMPTDEEIRALSPRQKLDLLLEYRYGMPRDSEVLLTYLDGAGFDVKERV